MPTMRRYCWLCFIISGSRRMRRRSRSRRRKVRQRKRLDSKSRHDLMLVSLSIWPLELNWVVAEVVAGGTSHATNTFQVVVLHHLRWMSRRRSTKESEGVYCISSRKEIPTYQECVDLPSTLPLPPLLIRFLFHTDLSSYQ